MDKRVGAKFCSSACKEPLSPEAADKRVRRYFKRLPPLPENLGKLLRAIGLTPADARRLGQAFGPHYWGSRYRPGLAQGVARPIPLRTAEPLCGVALE